MSHCVSIYDHKPIFYGDPVPCLRRTIALLPIDQSPGGSPRNVVSALYAFWASRQVATRNGTTTGVRQDSYSIVVFDDSSEVRARCILKSHLHSLQVLMEGNNTSTPDELVDSLIGRYNHTRGKNFDGAIRTARTVLGRQWNAQR